MNGTDVFDLYSDFLISSFGQTSATSMSNMLNGECSHDKITRLLAKKQWDSKFLWSHVKSFVRSIQSDDGVIICDDTLSEKPYTDENDIVANHYDHCSGRNVKGINLITLIYHSNEGSAPVVYEIVEKTEKYLDKTTGKEKRKSSVTKNERFRRMLIAFKETQTPFRYVLADTWYSSAENMMYIVHEIGKHFVMPAKSNRRVALSVEDKKNGKYIKCSALEWQENQTREVWLEGVDFPMLLVRQVFTNADNSTGILYLLTSDTTLDYAAITTIYKKRWKVERYHQSLKSNLGLEKSPTQTPITQNNHIVLCLCAFVKLEKLRVITNLNHFALKTKIYVNALQSAFKELGILKSQQKAVA